MEVKRHSGGYKENIHKSTHSMSLTFVSLNVGVLRARDDLIAAIRQLYYSATVPFRTTDDYIRHVHTCAIICLVIDASCPD